MITTFVCQFLLFLQSKKELVHLNYNYILSPCCENVSLELLSTEEIVCMIVCSVDHPE